ncbi:MAG TPA: hypothetical protein VM099_03420 [Gemmatimonadaceae bacterium]|nr:hypothetical protein [Gemmatimonadaceae bacterium]
MCTDRPVTLWSMRMPATFVAILLLSAASGCKSEPTPTAPTSEVRLHISGVMSPQYQGIRVARGSSSVTNAEVTVNGIQIPHCCGDLYSGILPEAVPAGATLNLEVVAAGLTFEAAGKVIAVPTITAPVEGSSFASTDTITLAWNNSTDPDRFEVCLNCVDNSLDGETYYALGSAREFRIAPGHLVDWGLGSVVAVKFRTSNFLKPESSAQATSNVEFLAKSRDRVVTIKY